MEKRNVGRRDTAKAVCLFFLERFGPFYRGVIWGRGTHRPAARRSTDSGIREEVGVVDRRKSQLHTGGSESLGP